MTDPIRRMCRDCKRKLPLDREHFAVHANCLGGFNTRCLPCLRAAKRASARNLRALRARIKARSVPLAPGQICPECFDLGHRRPFAGCPRCKLAHVPLPPIELVTRRSWEPAVAV